ncbi:MAG: urea ABC transporter ATP-binding protein UrtD [Ectothiorhodospiraceae bacterium]|nr:urea ABC transporter ATP-binding protein UrtD [Ectothiorhodospiraceae bacterium]
MGSARDRREPRAGGGRAVSLVGPEVHTPTLLYLDGVSVSFDGFKAIDGLSLVVDETELRCVIGPNGAGKTTMMDIITGRTRPDTGRVEYADGVDLTRCDESEIANLGIGRKFQKPTVFEHHTVDDNLELALAGRRSVAASLRFALGPEDRDRIDELLATVNLRGLRHRLAGTLSHGQKQWLEIGMLLAQRPRLLLVDEPVAGMTAQETERTAELLVGLATDHAVVVVEHDMEFVRSIARKVTVLHQGRVLAEGPMSVIQDDPLVNAVYLGE